MLTSRFSCVEYTNVTSKTGFPVKKKAKYKKIKILYLDFLSEIINLELLKVGAEVCCHVTLALRYTYMNCCTVYCPVNYRHIYIS